MGGCTLRWSKKVDRAEHRGRVMQWKSVLVHRHCSSLLRAASVVLGLIKGSFSHLYIDLAVIPGHSDAKRITLLVVDRGCNGVTEDVNECTKKRTSAISHSPMRETKSEMGNCGNS
jgi:hypothetical protein